MASKFYTAHEMRVRANLENNVWGDKTTAAMLRQSADEAESVGKLKSMLHEIAMIAHECNECDSYNYTEFCAEAINRISSVINASADAMEREERREKKYEYAEKDAYGCVLHLHDDTFEAADYNREFCGHLTSTIVRREVGEWVEVTE